MMRKIILWDKSWDFFYLNDFKMYDVSKNYCAWKTKSSTNICQIKVLFLYPQYIVLLIVLLIVKSVIDALNHLQNQFVMMEKN